MKSSECQLFQYTFWHKKKQSSKIGEQYIKQQNINQYYTVQFVHMGLTFCPYVWIDLQLCVRNWPLQTVLHKSQS